MGALAALTAIGSEIGTPGPRPDSKTALRTVLNEPFGEALLALIAAGLLCFAAWRLAQAIFDADRRGKSPSSLLQRLSWAGSALFYAGFGWIAVTMIVGSDHRQTSDQLAREWTAWLLGQPLGRWGVGAVGIGFLTAGASTVMRGLRADFSRKIDADKRKREAVNALGIAGFLARGFVFAMIGLFLVFAALHARSSEAKGFAGALDALQRYPYGWAILGLTSAGLTAFGLFEIAQAMYRRIEAPA